MSEVTAFAPFALEGSKGDVFLKCSFLDSRALDDRWPGSEISRTDGRWGNCP